VASGTVIVTGASSGIGEAAVARLGQLGFDVLAGVRKQEDAERLRSQGATPLMIDVADSDSIAAARAELGDRPLAGLVYNAGIAVSGPLEHLPIDNLRHQLEVNLIGQLALTQALLPQLRSARGRIVNVSSIGGRVATAFFGPYNASKFALEAASDALRQELRRWRVDVCLIEPGAIATPIWEKGLETNEAMIATIPAEKRELYSEQLDAMRKTLREAAKRGISPQRVAATIARALRARRPRPRYLVGFDARVQLLASRLLPQRSFDRLVGRMMGG
jgi:NAD(P)-dependent dehydrogenase (short-subunit alcohol dehydrogenase family)